MEFKYPAEVFPQKDEYTIEDALEMIKRYCVANGSNQHLIYDRLVILTDTGIGLNSASFRNQEITRGFFAFLFVVDEMDSAFTFLGHKNKAAGINLDAKHTWADFCREFKSKGKYHKTNQ